MKADAREISRTLAKAIESPEEALRVVKVFEKKLAGSQDAKYAVGTNSCTSGILASLLAIGIKKGHEIIVPSLSWGGTWSPAILLGAGLAPIDCSSKFPVMDPEKVKDSISKKTKAILVVGLWGQPAGIFELKEIAKENSIPLLVDAAQLFNSKVNGKGIGSTGDFVVMSFNCTKNQMALGEGGAVLCNNKEYYERLLLVTQHPVRNSFEVENIGYLDFNDGMNLNFKIHPLAAFIGIRKMEEYGTPAYLQRLIYFSEKIKEILARHGISALMPPKPRANSYSNRMKILIDAGRLFQDKVLSITQDFKAIGAEINRCCYETITGINKRRKGKIFPWSRKSLKISENNFPNSENWRERLLIVSVPKRARE